MIVMEKGPMVCVTVHFYRENMECFNTCTDLVPSFFYHFKIISYKFNARCKVKKNRLVCNWVKQD